MSAPDSPQTRAGILILGMHRSGTSSLTRLLNLAGLTLSRQVLPPTSANPVGYWESEHAYDLNQRFLRAANSAWNDWTPLNLATSTPRDELIRDAGRYIREEFADVDNFVLKDPRLCRVLPEWKMALALNGFDTKIVLALRNPVDVAASLKIRDGTPLSLGYFLWLRYVLESERASRQLRRVIVHYDDVMLRWRSILGTVSEHLGLTLNHPSEEVATAINSFIDPGLRHHNSSDEQIETDEAIHPWIKRVYRILKELSTTEQNAEFSGELDAIHSQFDHLGTATSPFVAASVVNDQRARLAEHYREVTKTDLQTEAAARLNAEDQVREASEALSTLRREFEKQAASHHSLTSETVALTAAHVSLRERLEAELARSQAEAVRLQNELDGLQVSLSMCEQEAAATLAELAAARDELNARIANLEMELVQREVRADRLESERDDLQTSLTEREHEASTTLAELAAARNELDTRTADLDKARSESRSIAQQRDEARESISSANRAAAIVRRRLEAERTVRNRTIAASRKIAKTRNGRERTAILADLSAAADAPKFDSTELDSVVQALHDTKLFNASWYTAEYPEVTALGIDPVTHFAMIGAYEGRDPNPYFFTHWYRTANADLPKHGNPLLHFVQRTRGERAFPNPLFDCDFYYDCHPDVAESDCNPLVHFIHWGETEGRAFNQSFDASNYAKAAKLEEGQSVLRHVLRNQMVSSRDLFGDIVAQAGALRNSALFDVSRYEAANPEVMLFPLDPCYDYNLRGWRLGRSPNLLFDGEFYRTRNADVMQANINPFLHFIQHGALEERSPHPLLDSAFYLSRHPDIKAAGVNPLLHYLRHGWKAHYSPSPFFDAAWYIKTYGEGSVRLNPLVDYLNSGRTAGRLPHPDFDPVHYLTNPSLAGEKIADPFLHYVEVGHRNIQIETAPGRRVHAHRQAHSTNASLVSKPSVKCVDRWHAPRWSRTIPMLKMMDGRVWGADELSAETLEEARRLLSEKPLTVSVVMPAWNRKSVIEGAIKSVLEQVYPVENLIVVDDGSTDGTAAYIREMFAEDIGTGRLKLIERAHKGLCQTRNVGINAATGDLIAYLDSDNTWHPFYTLLMAAVFAETPGLGTAYCAENLHDLDNDEEKVVGQAFDRPTLLQRNFIDLNCFVHRRELVRRHGGFDTSMTRLVDWELIIRYTELHPPAFVPVKLVEYYLDQARLNNVTYSENWESNWAYVRRKHLRELVRYGVTDLRIAYVIWDWPALSQTFVLNELRWLITHGIDVRVYYKTTPDLAAELDFEISAEQVDSPQMLADKLVRDRCTVMHSPFAYPATTLLTWPAAQETGIPFTFMPGGVDIAHHDNRGRNRIAEVMSDPLCLGAVTLGRFFRSFLSEQGAPMAKMIMERQAVGLPEFRPRRTPKERPRIISIGRFIEKKGLKYLVEAAESLRDCDIVLFGYGPLERELREEVKLRGLSNVVFAGTLDHTEALHDAYHAADLFVLPCVEAQNGDMDGLPTVLLEAMAAGVPVVTTELANIPDLIVDGAHGYLARPYDPASLVVAVRRVLALDGVAHARLVERASARARLFASDDRMMKTLLSVWHSRSIDIVLATYDTPEYADADTTIDIIDRIYEHTVMPFNLIVVDNASQPTFCEQLEARYGDRPNFNLIRLPENIFVGPATNIGIEAGSSEYIVYLCSKEGFILQNGWDLAVTAAMDARPQAGMGGYLITLPNYRDGKGYQSYPGFEKWRNQDFARSNPHRRMRHLQGGLLVIRRTTYESIGGFSLAVPHNGTDIEYAYYLESCGVELLDIPDIYSISSKTWPGAETIVDDEALAMHALTSEQAARFSRLSVERIVQCNLCSWQGKEFVNNLDHLLCPQCGSMPFDRSAMRHLSLSGILQRRPKVIAVDGGEALVRAVLPICKEAEFLSAHAWLESSFKPEADPKPVLILDFDRLPASKMSEAIEYACKYGVAGCPIVFSGVQGSADLVAALNLKGVTVGEIARASNALKLDLRPVWAAGFATTRELGLPHISEILPQSKAFVQTESVEKAYAD